MREINEGFIMDYKLEGAKTYLTEGSIYQIPILKTPRILKIVYIARSHLKKSRLDSSSSIVFDVPYSGLPQCQIVAAMCSALTA